MLDTALARATEQLRRGQFFEAHETLEEEWHKIPEGPLRQAVQGLIQICAGLHKRAQGNERGATYLLGRGLGRVERYGQALPGGSSTPFVEKARLQA